MVESEPLDIEGAVLLPESASANMAMVDPKNEALAITTKDDIALP
jgi:hypothetical protein